jgi:hypothetical protein
VKQEKSDLDLCQIHLHNQSSGSWYLIDIKLSSDKSFFYIMALFNFCWRYIFFLERWNWRYISIPLKYDWYQSDRIIISIPYDKKLSSDKKIWRYKFELTSVVIIGEGRQSGEFFWCIRFIIVKLKLLINNQMIQKKKKKKL